MLANFLLNDTSSILTHDEYSAGTYNTVVFSCPTKYRKIKALLSGPLTLSVTSKWSGYFEGGSGLAGVTSQLISLIDGFGQFAGQTVRQPWFSRKYWTGTDPLKFQLPLRFVAFEDAKTEVVDPMMGLLSLLYPADDDRQRKENLFRLYRVPGPTLFYGSSSPDKEGDVVKITLGEFLQFSGCYLTGVSFTIENSFTPEGYPHTVSATVSFESMDMCFTGPHGEFFTRGFGNQAQKTNEQWQKLVSRSQEGVGNVIQKMTDYGNKNFIEKGVQVTNDALDSLFSVGSSL